MSPKVSVLVPCYNVEKFLHQCMDSLVNQTLQDIEIICINDGSKDATLSILKEYAARDSRIIILDKPNSGYGDSMNQGLQRATGEYIGILESDDWAEKDMFDTLYSLAVKHQADVVKANFFRYTVSYDKKHNFLPQKDLDKIIEPKQNSAIFYCQPSIWSAIYRRDFLQKNHIDFLPSPGAAFQDIGFTFKVWLLAQRVYLTPQAFVHYRCDNTTSSTKSKDKIFCVQEEWDNIERFLDDKPALKKAGVKLRRRIRLHDYLFNMSRLEGASAEKFREHFAYYFRQVIDRQEMKLDCLDFKTYVQFMQVLYPKSAKYKLYWLMRNFIKLIYDRRLAPKPEFWEK